jgi:tetratricopeptide (TPR) repeat protein
VFAFDRTASAAAKIPLPRLDGSAGPPEKLWRDYFSQHQPASSAIAELILHLQADKKYDHVIAAIEAALLTGQSQPWMYDVLALTMQLTGRPKADVERALMSRLDFAATDVPSTLFSAAYLARFGAKEQALKLYRQAADIEPTRPEGYVLGLRLARDLKDYAAVQWTATGILQAAWNKDYEHLHREAEDAALDAERALRAAGKGSQADSLRDAMARARIRDLFVHLQWTGDGDLDLSVEEPLGTVASCQEPQTRGGGVHRHDGYGPDPKNCYEEYVCAFGVPGVYVVRVRRIDGTIVGNRAQLTVVRNQGAQNESTQTFVLKLNGDRAAVRIPVPNGRRRELVPDRPAVNAKTGLLERLLPVLLGQSLPGRGISWRALPAAIAPGSPLPGVAVPGIAAGPAGISAVAQAAAVAGPGLAVGYQPIIEEIPQGVTMTAAAVVSNDLRYVRLAINPSFTTITDIFTFTFVGGAP